MVMWIPKDPTFCPKDFWLYIVCQNLHPFITFHCQNLLQMIYISNILMSTLCLAIIRVSCIVWLFRTLSESCPWPGEGRQVFTLTDSKSWLKLLSLIHCHFVTPFTFLPSAIVREHLVGFVAVLLWVWVESLWFDNAGNYGRHEVGIISEMLAGRERVVIPECRFLNGIGRLLSMVLLSW